MLLRKQPPTVIFFFILIIEKNKKRITFIVNEPANFDIVQNGVAVLFQITL